MGNQTSTARGALPRFEDAWGLGPEDERFVREIVAALEKHGNLNRFGLCLLHDHFPVATDEVRVETHDIAARTLQVRVEKAATTGHTRPSQWRFLKAAGGSGAGLLRTGRLCTGAVGRGADGRQVLHRA